MKEKTENIKSYTDEKDANIQIYKDATYQAVCSLVTIPTHHFHEIYQHIYNHNIYVPTSLFYEKFEQRSDLWSRKIQSDPSLDARTGAILIVSKRKGMTRKTFFKGLKIGVTTKKFSRFDAAASFSVMNVWRRREESKSVWTEFPYSLPPILCVNCRWMIEICWFCLIFAWLWCKLIYRQSKWTKKSSERFKPICGNVFHVLQQEKIILTNDAGYAPPPIFWAAVI